MLCDRLRNGRIQQARPAPTPSGADLSHGIPVFLDQLIDELREVGSQDAAIRARSAAHGGELWELGLRVDSVVHCYGDVCQAVTELAMEVAAQLTEEDFHTSTAVWMMRSPVLSPTTRTNRK